MKDEDAALLLEDEQPENSNVEDEEVQAAAKGKKKRRKQKAENKDTPVANQSVDVENTLEDKIEEITISGKEEQRVTKKGTFL